MQNLFHTLLRGSSRNAVLVLMFIIFIGLLIFQGIDFTDQGFMLSNYSLLFQHPDILLFSAPWYTTVLFGALWEYILGRWGLLGMRLLYIPLIIILYLVSFKLLKGAITVTSLSWWILLSILLIYNTGGITPSYYDFTAVGMLLYIVTLIQGRLQGRTRWYGLAGFLFGFVVLFRFPNILAGLAPVIFWSVAYRQGTSRHKIFREFLIYCTGLSLSIIVLLGVMKYLGHYNAFMLGMGHLFAGSSTGEHSMTFMMIQYGRDILLATLLCAGMFALIRFYQFILQKARIKKTISKSLWFLLCIVGGVAGIYGEVIYGKVYYIISFLIFGLLLYYGCFLIFRKDWDSIQRLTLGGMLLMGFVFAGSNTGIIGYKYGITILFPFIVYHFYRKRDTIVGYSFYTFITIFLPIFYIIHLFIFTQRDGLRHHTLAYAHHQKIAQVATVEQRLPLLDDVLAVLDLYMLPGDRLLAMNSTSMILYIGGYIPYLPATVPDMYSPASLANHLASKSGEELPVILLAKGTIGRGEWFPTTPDNSVTEAENKIMSFILGDRGSLWGFSQKFDAQARIISEFIDMHGYRLVSDNEFFEVFVPVQS